MTNYALDFYNSHIEAQTHIAAGTTTYTTIVNFGTFGSIFWVLNHN